ncbi:uncharacterized protein V1518DRAFT_424778 [Limtongia smithiae]|uniref:uncharacterized protein n=1 Tax=Limtongia smithiae TaxID=1125753 RepID=UPI0034CDB6AB
MLSVSDRRPFHSSTPHGAEDTGNQNRKSPYQVFVDTFREEWGKSKELQDNIKALQDETGKMSESDAYRRAREAYEKARSGTSKTADTLKKAGHVVGSAAGAAWDSTLVKSTREAVNTTADTVEKATAPIRETKIYQEVKEAIDDGSSRRYGGFEAREIRRRRRAERESKKRQEDLKKGIITSSEPVTENDDAGTNLVVHKDAKPESESWTESPVFEPIRSMKQKLDESDNAFVSSIRDFAARIGDFFAETEYAQVMRTFHEMDPSFSSETFLREARDYIVPEVIDAFVKSDDDTLKRWLSEVPYTIWASSAKQVREAGLISASRVLDIRGIDISSAKLLPPNDVPVLVLTCRSQEVRIYKNMKTGEVAAGMEDHIQESTYGIVLTRLPENLADPETKGWKVLELVRGHTRDWV